MPAHKPFQFTFVALGSPCEFLLHEDNSGDAERAANLARSEVERIERVYSRYRTDSFTHRINTVAAAGGGLDLDPETADLVDLAFEAHRRSGGLFDLTAGVYRAIWNDDLRHRPDGRQLAAIAARAGLHRVSWHRPHLAFPTPGMEIDFGGIGKEYAADRAAGICRANGIRHGLIDLGGDLVVLGPQPDGAPWRIGIRDPDQPETAIVTLLVTHGALATSGNYARRWEFEGQRFGHILDPRSGWPVDGLASVTVWNETCLAAGLTSTIAMLMGETGENWLRTEADAYLVIDRAGALRGSIPIDGAASPI